MTFAAIAAGTYALALLWTIPAEVAFPPMAGVVAVDGTLWRGGASLIDGSRLDWRGAPLRSILNLGLAADFTVHGAGTDLAGRAVMHAGDVVIDKTSGSAAGSLLAVAMPGLPFLCGPPLQIALDRVRIGGTDQTIRGEVRSAAGLCAPKGGGAATLVPPVVASFAAVGADSAILVVPAGQRRRTFVDGTLGRDGKLALRVTPEGATALPFAAAPGGFRLETTL